jgi:hypothetical protein
VCYAPQSTLTLISCYHSCTGQAISFPFLPSVSRAWSSSLHCSCLFLYSCKIHEANGNFVVSVCSRLCKGTHIMSHGTVLSPCRPTSSNEPWRSSHLSSRRLRPYSAHFVRIFNGWLSLTGKQRSNGHAIHNHIINKSTNKVTAFSKMIIYITFYRNSFWKCSSQPFQREMGGYHIDCH